ncbi:MULTISPECIES: hypothetical protein [unclassified Afipia]|uniref:hypothetical protein n=1 Tax=unclassified Afipia TaxID=2642050 RepID=UPI00041BB605|nr:MULTISPECIES: hypothetical protein [unclassified Afipia]
MVKALSAVTIAAFVAAAMTILPSFAPPVEASVPQALAKADRLPIRTVSVPCAAQHWPTMDAACLHRSNWKSGVQPVRVVTTDRK